MSEVDASRDTEKQTLDLSPANQEKLLSWQPKELEV
jgi:hypothetical protein